MVKVAVSSGCGLSAPTTALTLIELGTVEVTARSKLCAPFYTRPMRAEELRRSRESPPPDGSSIQAVIVIESGRYDPSYLNFAPAADVIVVATGVITPSGAP